MSWTSRIAPGSASASRARRTGTAVIRGWRLREEDVQTAELLISEMVTNAVKFSARSQPSETGTDDSIWLELGCSQGKLSIAVTDRSPDLPVVGRPGSDAEHGRGMMLVAALSLEWGCRDLPHGGKTVYCVIPVEHDARPLLPLLAAEGNTS
jgi:anti-sigma regulatory factor (Ser/Thr protein kinase)